MEKNVGSVDLDELLKARQELNSERGIETDPNMYKDYNPNRKKEEAEQREGEPVMDEETAEMVADGEVPFEETVDDAEIIPEQETEEPSQVSAPEQEPEAPTDFSVYDNFAAFDVSGDEATVPEQTNTGAEPTVLSETPEPQEETPDASVAPVQPQDEQTSNLNMENFAVENESTIGNFNCKVFHV